MTFPRVRLVARFGGFRSPAARFVAGSAVAHLVLALGIVLWPGWRPSPRAVQEFIVVTPVALPGEPEPAPEAPAEEVRVSSRVPEPAPVPKPEAKRQTPPERPKPKPPKKAAPAPARDAPTAPAAGGPAARPAAPAGAVSGSTIQSLDVEDLEFAWYRDRVSAALKSHWRQPILEGVSSSLSVTIGFEVVRNGAVRNPEIELTSGVPSLDRSALRAVIEADPLPPLPSNWREPAMPARFVFTWYPPRLQ
jgi:TonB family protein